jgi:O-ureido-D-serine cyclo-ligase
VSVPVAIVSARAARGLDEDEGLLVSALTAQGAVVEVVSWDDAAVDYRGHTLALLRSTWDYTERLPEFLAWAARVCELTRLENPLAVVRWNTDKHYLADLARVLAQAAPGTARSAVLPADGAVIPGQFMEPGEDPAAALDAFLARHPSTAEVVVKPAVGAGSRDAQRHEASAREALLAHAGHLLAQGRSVLLQPYLARVASHGETALIFLDGVFSHAIRKGPLLPPAGLATTELFAREEITGRTPAADELELSVQVLAALSEVPALAGTGVPLYARVDLLRDDEGRPRLLELELCEPSLFLAHAPGVAERLAACVLARTRRG